MVYCELNEDEMDSLTEISPFVAALGGVFIGLASALLLFGMRRVAGISGIFSGLLFNSNRAERTWRALFILGLIGGAPLMWWWLPERANVIFEANWLVVIVAGLLVGLGVSLANGCTSGHGVCGMARLSKRSFVAVLVFLSTAMVTVYIAQHGIGG